MYHEIPIQKLSHAQILKLLKGERIRVKHGHGHHIHASHEQHKKIMSAHKKGKGCTIQFDPYQSHMHKSNGIFDNIGKAFHKIESSPITKEIIHQAAPIVLDAGKKYLENKLSGHGMHHMHHSQGHGVSYHPHHEVHHESFHGSGEGTHHHHLRGRGGLSNGKKKGKGKHKDHGGSLTGGALMPAGYGEGKGHAARRRGKGISGKQVLDGFLKYGVPALETGAMFL